MSEDEDAQRILERKAVANARSLVEKLEAGERDDRVEPESLIRLSLVVLVVGVAVTFAAGMAWKHYQAAVRPAPVMLPTAAMTADEYARQAVARIEWVVNNTKGFKEEMAPYDGRVELAITIDPKGYIDTIEVTKPSSSSRFEGQVTRMMKFAEPFGALPTAVRASSSELRLARTARIAPSKSGDKVFSIEGAP